MENLADTVPLPLLGGAAMVLGAIVGSFLGTVLLRWPQGRSAASGRSHCDGCARALGPFELVPILSYLAIGGRCRRCGAAIDWRHVAMEAAAAAVALIAVLAHPLPLAGATMLLGWWLLLIAALDAEHHWLPDALTLPLIALGLLAGWAGLGPPLVDRFAGAAAGWLALVLIAVSYQRLRGQEGMGGGDPKLLAAIGAWLGVLQLPFVLLGAGMFGLAAVGIMTARGAHVGRATRLPLGTLMALAAWPIWLIGHRIHSGSIQNFML